jgi:putative transposase
MILRAIKIKLYPTIEQKILLDKHFGACRFIYNLALEYKIYLYTYHRIFISNYDLKKQITDCKKESSFHWLNDIKAESLLYSIDILNTAFKNFFRGNGFPKFKSKRNRQSFHQQQNLKILSNTNRIVFYSNKIKFKCSERDRELLNTRKLRNITYSKDKSNQYWASVLIEDEIKQLEPIRKEIGIDLGLKHFAITSDRELIDNPKYFRKNKKKLKRIQRWHSRKEKGSNNREKSRIKLVKQYQKITNQRNNFLNTLSKRLIDENQIIHLETLNVKGMMQNHKLAKSIQDASWSKFVGMLKYKSNWYGREIYQINRFAPSSKTCSECGWVNKYLTLKDRIFVCHECGMIEDRDTNAAKNIMKISRDGFTRINVCGDGLYGRPFTKVNLRSNPSMKQEDSLLVNTN